MCTEIGSASASTSTSPSDDSLNVTILSLRSNVFCGVYLRGISRRIENSYTTQSVYDETVWSSEAFDTVRAAGDYRFEGSVLDLAVQSLLKGLRVLIKTSRKTTPVKTQVVDGNVPSKRPYTDHAIPTMLPPANHMLAL